LESDTHFGSNPLSLNKTNLAYGLEFEYILPTNAHKWALLIDLERNRIKTNGDLPDGMSITDKRYKVDYAAVETSIGGRYYGFLSTDFKFFATGVFSLNFVKNGSYVEYNGGENPFETMYMEEFSFSGGVGLGLSYKKLNAEVRYHTPQKFYKNDSGSFSKIALTVSYAIF
jgi:hypothetical protein